ncbi:MAG: adenine phosphoribosyltransferase, partial [Candidatus Zixiibacteriota bacterium]
MIDLKKTIRSVPDFPKKGIVFRDITTLLDNPAAYRQALDTLEQFCREKKAAKILGIEARG